MCPSEFPPKKKYFDGKPESWQQFQEDVENWLREVHKIQPIAFVVGETENTFKKTSYGPWHTWTVLQEGPHVLWPLIFSLWKNTPPKISIKTSSELPIDFEKFSYGHPLDELYEEDWTGQESGGAMKQQMHMMLGKAVKFWEHELKKLPTKDQHHFTKNLSPEQIKFIKVAKKFYPVWI